MKTKLFAILTFFALSFSITGCKEECEELYKEGCDVDSKYRPVCGCNGKTYANSTYADCAGVEYTDGKCEDQQ